MSMTPAPTPPKVRDASAVAVCVLGRRSRGVVINPLFFVDDPSAVSSSARSIGSGVLTDWPMEGDGIILKPVWEVLEHLRSGRLRAILADFSPEPMTVSGRLVLIRRETFGFCRQRQSAG